MDDEVATILGSEAEWAGKEKLAEDVFGTAWASAYAGALHLRSQARPGSAWPVAYSGYAVASGRKATFFS